MAAAVGATVGDDRDRPALTVEDLGPGQFVKCLGRRLRHQQRAAVEHDEPKDAPADFWQIIPKQTQDPKIKVGIFVEDNRGGIRRWVVPSEGQNGISNLSGGCMLFQRNIVNDVPGQGGGYTVNIENWVKGG